MRIKQTLTLAWNNLVHLMDENPSVAAAATLVAVLVICGATLYAAGTG